MTRSLRILAFILLSGSICSAALAQKVRISAWYWLNAAPKVAWQGDFVTMKNMGFTDVLLSWGIDVSGVNIRVEDTRRAIEEAHRAGLGSYLVVWQPTANTLKRRPEFMQVDSAGNQLFSFDVFNQEWRSTEWKEYLQGIAQSYHNEPGMAGYVFDDSFLNGPVGNLDGHEGTGIVAYGKYEQEHFGRNIPKTPSDPRWDEWVKIREGWWEDWAKDTVAFIRQIDPDTKHEIYLEDPAGNALNPNLRNTIGLDFARVAKHFDAVGAYSSFSYTSSPDSGSKAAAETTDIISRLQRLVGGNKATIYTYWVADPAEELEPGAAKFPTAEQIRQISEAALRAGISHLDMYGFRIGDYRVNEENFAQKTPGSGDTYPLTDQFPQKFLWDRPQIQDELAQYLRSLNQGTKVD